MKKVTSIMNLPSVMVKIEQVGCEDIYYLETQTLIKYEDGTPKKGKSVGGKFYRKYDGNEEGDVFIFNGEQYTEIKVESYLGNFLDSLLSKEVPKEPREVEVLVNHWRDSRNELNVFEGTQPVGDLPYQEEDRDGNGGLCKGLDR